MTAATLEGACLAEDTPLQHQHVCRPLIGQKKETHFSTRQTVIRVGDESFVFFAGVSVVGFG